MIPQPQTMNSSEGGVWVREPQLTQDRARIAGLEAGLEELRDLLFHEDWCDANLTMGGPARPCICAAAEQAALIARLLESR